MSKQKLKLGISPCPNDTFIFHALTHGKLNSNFEFEVEHLDVEALNQSVTSQQFDVCKLSYATLANVLDDYQILRSGGALGKGVGPLLIAREELSEAQIDEAVIAIPGENTTANFLLSLAYPRAKQKKVMLFSDIENAVLNGEVDAGLIIHENRFTYQDKGLICLLDLGNYWEEVSSALIPLGGIAVKRSLDPAIKQELQRLISQSVQYAFDHPQDSNEYVKAHAAEMDKEVIQKHIDLYVNEYSVDVGVEGEQAVKTLFDKAVEKELVEEISKPIFVS
jgi:1,4-dihydroxy-6-naphthoate synthase